MYPNRTLCQVLEELRSCYETRNFASFLGLIEEVQSMANRMESALQDQRDINALTDRRAKLYDEVEALKKERKTLRPDAGEIEWVEDWEED